MKRIFTLSTGVALFFTAQSQAVLNELYTIPNAGKHEFFELYNNSVTVTPVSMHDYTIITYFEGAGSEKGFYVLDLPDLILQPKGYLVGSSALPFNYQGILNCTKSQFSWNNLAFLASNNGYLKKWVVGNIVPGAIDGNANYDERPVPANFNDFMCKRSGAGASYTMFVYKNGTLVNAFFGGINSTTVPAFIMAMPSLNIQIAGGSLFTVNFAAYATIHAEFVNAEAGSDNGYIRTRDGLCGLWTKSSAGAQHTPGETNGPQTSISGNILMVATIEQGGTSSDSSTVVYKVLSAPAGDMPLTLDLYVDNGTKLGELDGTDTYITSKTITTVTGTQYRTKFMPHDASVLITVRTAAGCFDKVLFVANLAILPINVLGFTGTIGDAGVNLQWKVTENETAKLFEVQESGDGIQFTTIGSVPASGKPGFDQYSYQGTQPALSTGFYRLKITGKGQTETYSKVIKLTSRDETGKQGITLKSNPVESYLMFTYNATALNTAEISIYSMTGTKLYATSERMQKGLNTHTLNLGGRILPGTYVMEIKSGPERSIIKFLKK